MRLSRRHKFAIVLSALLVSFPPGALALNVGDTAPDFDLPEADGGNIRLSDHAGKVRLVNFWATWCEPCKVEMPQIEEDLQQVYGPDNFTAILLNQYDDIDVIREYKHGFLGLELTYPMGEDTFGEASGAYGVPGLPYNVIIDQEGIVQYIEFGFTKEDIISKVQELLGVSVKPATWGSIKARYSDR